MNLLTKTIKLSVHPEDVAFGGRGEIATLLTKELARAVYENMVLSDDRDDDLLTMSITVYIPDNRHQWQDNRTFTEIYNKEHNET